MACRTHWRSNSLFPFLKLAFFFRSNCRSYGVSELARRINVVRFMLNTQVAVALVVSVLLVLWLWRRELAAGASVLLESE